MENIDFMSLFQGVGTMMESGWLLASARMFLVALGFLLIYLGWKGVLERCAGTDGNDTDGIGNDSHQLWYADNAGRYIGKLISRSDAF